MPKDKGYLLPEVIDPQRIRLCIEVPNDLNHLIAFWDTIARLSRWFNWAEDDEHTARLAAEVWRDVYYKARESWLNGECASEETCQTYRMSSPRITWFPENPYRPGVVPPDGYLFHPFTVVTTSIIDQVISQFGLGYQVGDVYTDLLHIPAWEGGEDPINVYNDFPYFRVNDLNGAGTVKLHLLNLPQGGSFLIVKDGEINLLALQVIEMNKDGASIPAETQVPQIIEVKFEEVGEHYLDVVWLPTLNDTLIPIYFGGGVRQVEICGFGLQGCDDVTDPCCPETNDTLKQILNLLKGGATINFNTPTQSPDFTVDCTPDGFGGNEGDDTPTQIMRNNAMCLAVTRWLVSIMASQAVKMNQSGKLAEIWALGGFLSAPEMYAQIQYVETDMSIAHLDTVLDDDTAFNLMVCRVMLELATEDNTFAIFKKQFDEIYDDVSMEENPAFTILAMVARDYSKNRVNYTVFSRELEIAFEQLQDGLDFDCGCATSGTCDPADFEIIGVDGTEVTRIDDTHWHVVQTAWTPYLSDKREYNAIVRDVAWRCFNLVSPTGGWAGYKSYLCDGTYSTGPGGGTGNGIQIGMITLEYLVDPEVGIDVIFEIVCP